jgi:hypothetical protein
MRLKLLRSEFMSRKVSIPRSKIIALVISVLIWILPDLDDFVRRCDADFRV